MSWNQNLNNRQRAGGLSRTSSSTFNSGFGGNQTNAFGSSANTGFGGGGTNPFGGGNNSSFTGLGVGNPTNPFGSPALKIDTFGSTGFGATAGRGASGSFSKSTGGFGGTGFGVSDLTFIAVFEMYERNCCINNSPIF